MAPIASQQSWWTLHHDFLLSRGYKLPTQYQPGYQTPQYKNFSQRIADPSNAPISRSNLVPAVRLTDGRNVMLKACPNDTSPHEVVIARLFSSPPLKDDPRNHCIPVEDVFLSPYDPEREFIVMPMLNVFHRTPHFDTIGEFVEALRQIIEGLEFMHFHRVAHRDVLMLNIMLDGSKLFPKGFHPQDPRRDAKYKGPVKSITRTECWPRYYIIDFGFSQQFPYPTAPAEWSIPLEPGQTHLVPEKKGPVPRLYNPFPVDIFMLGDMLRYHFSIYEHPPLQFLRPLVDEMLQEDPASRPIISEVAQRLAELCRPLTEAELRLPGSPKVPLRDQKKRQKKHIKKNRLPLPFPEFPMPQPMIDPGDRPYYSLH